MNINYLAKRDLGPNVNALTRYLADNPDLGMFLVIKHGGITFHLEPGLEKNQGARWEKSLEAIQLFIDAGPDLKRLVKSGKITLPIMTVREPVLTRRNTERSVYDRAV